LQEIKILGKQIAKERVLKVKITCNEGKQDEKIKPLCLHGPKLAHGYFLDLDLL
jgi:hypothetical protein